MKIRVEKTTVEEYTFELNTFMRLLGLGSKWPRSIEVTEIGKFNEKARAVVAKIRIERYSTKERSGRRRRRVLSKSKGGPTK